VTQRKGRLVPFPILVGLLLTSVLIALVAVLALHSRCAFLASGTLECRSNFYRFLDSPPNEIGDTIAGVFSTLAFVWIVVTVFLQSAELFEQRQELALTREELRLAREAQEKQLEVMGTQARIFEDEQRQRHENRAKEKLDLLLPWLAPRVAQFGNNARLTYAGYDGDLHLSPVFSGNWRPENITSDDFPFITSEFEKTYTRLPPYIIAGSVSEEDEFRTLSSAIKADIHLALDLKDRLSDAERFRVSISGLERIVEMIIDVERRLRNSSGAEK
jgi:hypothetical protein